MRLDLGKLADRWARPAGVACLVYCLVCTLLLLTGWGGEATGEYIGLWGTYPLALATGLMLWPVITDASLSRRRRLAFRLIFASTILDSLANAGWGYYAAMGNETVNTWPDVLYLF